MRSKRRAVGSAAALALMGFAGGARAQFGRRRGDRGEGDASRSRRDDGKTAPLAVRDPAAAIERELPSLRVDLKIAGEQAVLFDGFERHVRAAAEAERTRARHVAGFRREDAPAVSAETVMQTLAQDDALRAEALQRAAAALGQLSGSLDPERRKQLDQRIIQALRDPLGTS